MNTYKHILTILNSADKKTRREVLPMLFSMARRAAGGRYRIFRIKQYVVMAKECIFRNQPTPILFQCVSVCSGMPSLVVIFPSLLVSLSFCGMQHC